MSGTPSPLRWGIVGLGWVTADFVALAMVKSAGSRLVACLGSSLAKGQVFAAAVLRSIEERRSVTVPAVEEQART